MFAKGAKKDARHLERRGAAGIELRRHSCRATSTMRVTRNRAAIFLSEAEDEQVGSMDVEMDGRDRVPP